MSRRGKRAFIVTGCLASIVVAATIYALRDVVVGEWQLRQLDSPDSQIRSQAAEILGRIRYRSAVPKLLATYERHIKEAGPVAELEAALLRLRLEALDGVLDLVAGDNQEVIARTLELFHKIARDSLPGIRQRLTSSRAAVRRACAVALGAHSPDPKIDAIILAPLIKDPDAAVREAAFKALSSFGPEASAVVPTLYAILLDVQAPKDARLKARSALCTVGPASLPVVRQAFQHNDPVVRWLAADFAKEFKTYALEALPQWIDELRGPESSERLEALRMLAEVGKNAATAAEHVVPLVGDANNDVRWTALYALEALEARIEVSQPILDFLCRTGLAKDDLMRALLILHRVRQLPEDTTSVVTPLLASADADVRWLALKVLGKIGAGAASAIPAIFQASKVEARRDQGSAVLFWNMLRIFGEPAATYLADRLLDPEDGLHAVRALAQLDSAARSAVPGLIRMLASQDLELALEAARALQVVGPEASAALPGLVQLSRRLHESEHHLRLLRSMAAIGLGSAELAAVLVPVLAGDDPGDRSEAAYIAARNGRLTPDLEAELRHALTSELANLRLLSALAILAASPNDKEASSTLESSIVPAVTRPSYGPDPSKVLPEFQALAKLCLPALRAQVASPTAPAQQRDTIQALLTKLEAEPLKPADGGAGNE